MTIFNEPHGHVIDANSGLGTAAVRDCGGCVCLVIMLFASVARVDSGHVGVLTLVWPGDRRGPARGSSPDQSLQGQP